MHNTLDENLFMKTFFSTKKTKKSLIGNTCYQFFAIDKGFTCVVLLKHKSEVTLDFKYFANEIGALEAVITNAVRYDMSKEIK